MNGPQLNRKQTLVVLSGLLLGLLLAALDQMIVSTALPMIVSELHGLEHMAWVVTAYLLASTVAMPLCGKISDLYGRKPVYLFVIVVFLAGSILCGMAQSMTQLIIFRAVQGIGGGGLMLSAMAIVADIVPPRERGRYQSLFGTVFALASVAGPLVGGFFTDHLTWRWIFYINLPLGAAALIVTMLALKLPRPTGKPKIDYTGALLIGAAVTCVVLLTSWGGARYAWDSPVIIGLGIAGTVLFSLFVLTEARVAEPITPLRLFRHRTLSVSGGVSFLVGFAMFGSMAFLPLFLQLVSGASATNSGLLLLPLMLGAAVSSVVSGQVISKVGRYKAFPVVGTALATGGMLLLSTMGEQTGRLVSGTYMVVLGLGLGMVMQVVILAVQNCVPRRDLGTGTSTVTCARQIGAAFGVAVFGAIFNSRLSSELASHLPATAPVPPISSISRTIIESLPAQIRDGVVAAFSAALTDVFRYASLFLMVAFLTAWFLKEQPLRDRRAMTAGPAQTAEPELVH